MSDGTLDHVLDCEWPVSMGKPPGISGPGYPYGAWLCGVECLAVAARVGIIYPSCTLGSSEMRRVGHISLSEHSQRPAISSVDGPTTRIQPAVSIALRTSLRPVRTLNGGSQENQPVETPANGFPVKMQDRRNCSWPGTMPRSGRWHGGGERRRTGIGRGLRRPRPHGRRGRHRRPAAAIGPRSFRRRGTARGASLLLPIGSPGRASKSRRTWAAAGISPGQLPGNGIGLE